LINPDELTTERISAFDPIVCFALFQACLRLGRVLNVLFFFSEPAEIENEVHSKAQQ
jgi:hypothetical protein